MSDEALLQRSQIARLQKPSKRTLTASRDYVQGSFSKGSTAAAIPIIEGSAREYLEDEVDLVALNKPAEEDYLSRIAHASWPVWGNRNNDPFNRTLVYKNANVGRAVAAIGLILAAVLLVGAIVHLYFVRSPSAKLGLVAMYALLFALSVAFCTNAKRVEVFAATAAYAAVLVVFVSGDLGGANTEQCLIPLEGGIFKVVKCPP
jgi:hypothetical protein